MKRVFNILALLAAASPLAWSATALDISQAAVKITSPGEYLVSGSSSTHNITVETTGDVTLRLQGVRLDLASSFALYIKKGNVTLQLQDSSVLIAGGTSIYAVSGFSVEDYVAPANDDGKIGVLVATGKGGNGIYGSPVIRSGKLTAAGGSFSSGIHPYWNPALRVEGGIVKATGGSYAAGIGGNQSESAGAVEIAGGEVTAVSGGWAAAIGGGGARTGGNGGSGGKLTISGGQVFAVGASSSSATLSLRQPGLSQGLTMLEAYDLKGRPVYSARVPQDFDLRLLPLRPGHYLVKMDHTLRSWQVPKD